MDASSSESDEIDSCLTSTGVEMDTRATPVLSHRSATRNESKTTPMGWLIKQSLQDLNSNECMTLLLSLKHQKEVLFNRNQWKQENEVPKSAQQLSGLIEVLKVLTMDSNQKGFITFQHAYEIYAAHIDGQVNMDTFQLNLLDQDHGLPINIIHCNGIRYIVVKSQDINICNFLQDLGVVKQHEDLPEQRMIMDSETVNSFINSMDSEWDRGIAKILVGINMSQREMKALGFKPTTIIQQKEKKVELLVEIGNAKLAATDLVTLNIKAKIDEFNKEVMRLQQKMELKKDVLPPLIIDAIQLEINVLKERLEYHNSLLEQSSKKAIRAFQGKVARSAESLVKEHRLKQRKLTTQGAKRKLDSSDEEFIHKCIQDRSTSHGRRHDNISYTGGHIHSRIKKRHFLTIANYR